MLALLDYFYLRQPPISGKVKNIDPDRSYYTGLWLFKSYFSESVKKKKSKREATDLEKNMTQDEMKRKAAEAAMEYVVEDEIIGVASIHTGLLQEGLHFEIRHKSEAQDPLLWVDEAKLSFKNK